MTETQRNKNDRETTERRQKTDRDLEIDRTRNDIITADRREAKDKSTEEDRTRNDIMTADRRREKDGTSVIAITMTFLIFLALIATAYFVFIV